MILLIAVPKSPSSPCPPVVIGETLASGKTISILPRELTESEQELCRLGIPKLMKTEKPNADFSFLLLPVGASLPKDVRDQVRIALGLYIPKSSRLRKVEKMANTKEA